MKAPETLAQVQLILSTLTLRPLLFKGAVSTKNAARKSLMRNWTIWLKLYCSECQTAYCISCMSSSALLKERFGLVTIKDKKVGPWEQEGAEDCQSQWGSHTIEGQIQGERQNTWPD